MMNDFEETEMLYFLAALFNCVSVCLSDDTLFRSQIRKVQCDII